VHDIIDALLSALHLWTRAYESLARQHLTERPTAQESNPFAATDPPQPSASVPETSSFSRRSSMSGIEWRIAEGLLTSMFALQRMYFLRGSVREAEYFCRQAEELALAINAPIMAARARGRKGEILLFQGHVEDAYKSLQKAQEYLGSVGGLESVTTYRLLADHQQRVSEAEEAHEKYSYSMQLLDELDGMFSRLEGNSFRYVTRRIQYGCLSN
jgi:separase